MADTKTKTVPSDLDKAKAQVVEITAERDKYKALAAADNDQIVKLSEGLIERGLADEENEFDPVVVALTEFDLLQQDRDSIKRSLSAQKAATTRKKDIIEEIEAAAKPREVGRMTGDAAPPAELLELLADAEAEIVFSDGRSEIEGMPSLRVTADSFRKVGSALHLNVGSLEVHGPAQGSEPYRIAGYGLLIEGEQAAWTQRPEQLSIGAGQTYNLAADIAF